MGSRARGPFGIAYSPGEVSRDGRKLRIPWEEVLQEALSWLHRVREDEGPSLWELAEQDRKLLTSAEEAGLENTPFSPEEQRRLGATLDEVLKEVRSQGALQAEQIKLFGAFIEEAKEASKRLPRRDWVFWLYGGIFNLVIQAAFAPTQAQHLWQLAGQAIHWIFTSTPLLGR